MAMATTKKRRLPPISKLSAKDRAKQFPDDFYEDDGIMFCKYCQHSIEFVRIDTCKDHIASYKHMSRKNASRPTSSTPKQVTITAFAKSKDLREDFILDFVKMCTMADIPLEKTSKMRGFIEKHCRQGGSLPQCATLRQLYVPRLFISHFACLKTKLFDLPVSIMADETTDDRDQSILNIVAGVRGNYYLIDVIKMDSCNHATLSQAVVTAVTGAEIKFKNVMSFVSDSAAYCKKAFREVLHPIFPNALHVLCLAHIMNLLGDIFAKWADFGHTATLVSMIKSAFYKKPGRKSRYLAYIKDFVSPDQVKLPPVPVSTRWNSWFASVIYHATHIHLYEGFFKAEKSQGMAVERIIELVTHKTIYPEIVMQMWFISENCTILIKTLTSLEATRDPLAVTCYNVLEDVRSYLQASSTKESFGVETDQLLTSKFQGQQRKQIQNSFQGVFKKALDKFESHVDNHPAKEFYKAARIFDPRQLSTLPQNIKDYTSIPALRDANAELQTEWLAYVQMTLEDLQVPQNISELRNFWSGLSARYPLLGQVAKDVLWMPVSSVDVERSFSQYKHLLNDHRFSLTETATKQLIMLYFNGDIEHRF